ncbi:MAG: glycosyltransferase family 4 protein [Rikenellaceae bacterium]|nr:glycosyltransferase family 4 protein [Rikenellaceae bacterium]
MKILFDGLCLNSNFSGVQYYAYNLMKQASFDRYGEFVFDTLVPAGFDYGKYTQNLISVRTRNRVERIWYEHTVLKKIFKTNKYDIFHNPSYILPRNFNNNSVVTVHDLIAKDFPKLCKNSNALYYNLQLKNTVKKASKIIAVSHKVKNDIIRSFDIYPEKIEVIYHGVDDIFFNRFTKEELKENIAKYNIPEKYILFVGNLEPKKNLSLLIQAFSILRQNRYFEHKLLIVGQLGWKYKEIFKTVDKLKLRGKVIFLDYVERNDLPLIYQNASLFVFPSIYEGFGIPPLEAMASGIPVIVSNAGALPEITSGYCLYTDPYSVEELSMKIELGLNSTPDYVSEAYKHARSFTWEKCWSETKKVYESINPGL